MKLLLTCEHGGYTVPDAYRARFSGARDVLRSHRGWDPGALRLFERMRPAADAAYAATVTRLLVELNRSQGHPSLFSEYTRGLDAAERTTLLDAHYHPFRRGVAARVERWMADGAGVLHVSVHSFTPVLDGRRRELDIGLLYDPGHGDERALAAAWRRAILAADPVWRVRHNQPYRGVADGQTRWLRAAFGPRYCGVELEVRNDHLRRAPTVARLATLLTATLRPLLASWTPQARK